MQNFKNSPNIQIAMNFKSLSITGFDLKSSLLLHDPNAEVGNIGDAITDYKF